MKNTAEIAYRASLTRSKVIGVETVPLSLHTSRDLLLREAQMLQALLSESYSHSRKAAKEFRFEFGRGPNAEEIAMAAAMSDY